MKMSDVSHKTFVGKLSMGYALPNTLFPLFCARILRKMRGPGNVMQLMASLILIGQVVLFLSLHCSWTGGIVLGYMLFGMGAESIGAFCNSFVSTCVATDSNKSFLLAICGSMSRLGSCAVFFLGPRVSTLFGVDGCFWSVLLAALICFISSIYCRNIFQSHQKTVQLYQAQQSCPRNANSYPTNAQVERLATKKIVVLCISFLFTVNSFFPLSWHLSRILQHNYRRTSTEAGSLISLAGVFCIFVLPLAGFLIDKFRIEKRNMMMLNSSLIIVSISIFIFQLTPLFATAMLSCNYAIFASCFWTSLPGLLHDTNTLCSVASYSICACNLAGAIFTPFASYLAILDKTFQLLLKAVVINCAIGMAFLFNVGNLNTTRNRNKL